MHGREVEIREDYTGKEGWAIIFTGWLIARDIPREERYREIKRQELLAAGVPKRKPRRRKKKEGTK